jgi:ABC-type nickel/cobalt efflux system permease component RcnA
LLLAFVSTVILRSESGVIPDHLTSTHKGRKHHTQVDRTTYKQEAKHNHNNRLTHGTQHANTQRDVELYRLDKWTTLLVEV